ncbi:MAG: DNA polymerase/3'-5' exonuclease PolX [Candidatus Krumholzibacteria bacterium]|nr:DNA polymerase/3'-5' exonuclease PolX [Candidatus Krumholzibacteria bacterium]
MNNRAIASVFNKISDILELRGENRFRISAYRRAAQNIEGLSRDIEEVASEGKLRDIPGIGKELVSKIEEYLDTGKVSFLNDLLAETPHVLLDMLQVQGIGPKTAVFLYEELELESLSDLKRAAREQRIRSLPKMKAKTEENILKGIEFLERVLGRTPIGTAYPLARSIIAALEKLPEAKKISPAGSLRRWREDVGDIDILATSSSPEKVMRHFTHLDDVDRVLAEGKTKGSVITKDEIQIDLRVVERNSYGAALCYFTGSKEHNIRLREIAIQMGMKLNEYGVFKKYRTGEKRIAGRTESEVYSALGLPYIPPEIRENTGEIEAARDGTLPLLVSAKSIKGDLHVHSDWSDGNASLAELAETGKEMGYGYIVVSDHSKSLRIAHGLTEERLHEQIDEINHINKHLEDFRLLKGIEVDILPDGSLDLSDDVLCLLDVVIIAVHSNFRMNRDKMTQRVIRAINNPYSNILAHPTGRLIGTRDEYDIDMDAIISAAAETGTALEINAHPLRLDLNAIMARKAAESGVLISIGTDAHNPFIEMHYMIYGLGTARRGWLTRSNILNTRTAGRLLKSLRKKKPGNNRR